MEYRSIVSVPINPITSSISVSPYGKNKSKNSSVNRKNKYINNRILNSIDNDEDNDYKNNLLLKEKNTIIQKLQKQINILMTKEEEKDKKIKMQKQMIDSLKGTIKNLQEELSKKNLIIQQNQNIEKQIFHLQKEYLEDSNNSSRNNIVYIQSIRDNMNKLVEKELEINNYKKNINLLKSALKEKENEIIKKNGLLEKFSTYMANEKHSVLNYTTYKSDKIPISTGKKAKSVKNYSSENNDNKFRLKEDLKQINTQVNKPSIDLNKNILYKSIPDNIDIRNNYHKLLENYNDIKTKCNYYYKLAHNLSSKNNKLNEQMKNLIKNINEVNKININLKKILSKQRLSQEKENSSKKRNNNNIHLILNNKNSNEFNYNDLNERKSETVNNKQINNIKNNKGKILNIRKSKTSSELISDDDENDTKVEYKDNNNIYNNKDMQVSNNKATKKLYEALEKYRKLYNDKDKENNIIKIKLEEKEKIIESQNSLHKKITEYLNIIDELETANKTNKDLIDTKNNEINKLNNMKKRTEEKIKLLEKEISDGKKIKNKFNEKIEKLNNDIKEKDSKIKQLISDLKDKEILIKEEQINSLIKINNSENKKEDFNKKINELQSFISQMKKELSENKSEINKLSEENNLLKQKNTGLENNLNKIETEKNAQIQLLKEEKEEKTTQLDYVVKMLNDKEIQNKDIKYDNQELVQGAKQCMNIIKQKEIKINQLISMNENLKKLNQNLLSNNQLFNDEKNKLINNYNNLLKELKEKKENIEYLQSILIQKTEIIDNVQKSNDELTLDLNRIKTELKQKKIEINQYENQYNKLKQNTNISKDIFNLIEENNKIKIENKTLQNKINELNNENNIYNSKLNEINQKYQEQKLLVQEKEKEIINLKEASKAILEKHKKFEEEKNQKIDPNTYKLISSKNYNKLTWYLLQKKSDQKNYSNDLYDKFIWVTGNIIKKDDLKKYNQYEDDEQKIKDLQEYNINLQKKLERKEESINLLDYKNKKLMEQLQNKTFANPGSNKLKFNLGKNDRTNYINNNGSMGERGFESEKFKNILQQLNYSNLRETKLQKEVKILKEKLKKKEEFEAGFPKNFKDIEPFGNDSGFLDDDFHEQEKKCIIDIVKSNTDDRDKLSTKKSETNYNDNMDENKKLKEEIFGLKNNFKEVETKYKNLEDMVKDLIKNVKYEPIIKPHIVQICQILGYSPQTTNKIVKSKISGLKNFELK